MQASGAATEDIVTTRDGTQIFYRVIKGSGSGRCALVHSLAMDASFWDGVVPYLEEAGRRSAHDCRGHGRSGKAKGSQPIERHADDLADVLDAAGWKQAVVAGASMGGCISLAFAARYPDRVSGLGLIDTTAWYGPDAPQQWEERGQKGLREGMAALVPFQLDRWVSESFRKQHPEIIDHAVAVFLASDTEAYLETCRMLGAADLRKLPTFSFPTRIVVGEQDYATPIAMAEAMRDLIPGAILTVLDNVRHLTPLEAPDLVAGQLKALLPAGH